MINFSPFMKEKEISIKKTIEFNKNKDYSDKLKISPIDSLLKIIKNHDYVENYKYTIEFSFGIIKDIFSLKRINYDTSQAIIFNSLTQSHIFEEGIKQDFYNRNIYKYEEQDFIKTTDIICIYNMIRKISVKGEIPIYQKKYKSTLCYIYFPNRKYDIRITICRLESIENPDRNNKLYVYPKNREKTYFFENNIKFIIKRISNIEISDVNNHTKKKCYYYGMKASILYDKMYNYINVINKILKLNTENENYIST